MSLRALAVGGVCLAILGAAALIGGGLDGPQGEFILWQLRVPRVLVGALVGCTLGLVGACFQTLFANPLATPSTVGTTAGATLGALVALVFDLGGGLSALPVVTLLSFVGALTASLLVAAVAARPDTRTGDVLLAGIAITLATGALSQGVQHLADARALFSATQWSLGQLPQVGYTGVLVLLPFVALSTAILLFQTRALEALISGDELASARGVAVRRLRLTVLTVGSLGVAACVAWCGPIAFVGLLVPHLVRLTLGSAQRVLLPMSAVTGAAFLVACDVLARSIGDTEWPVGVVTAALGAPALFMLVARRRR